MALSSSSMHVSSSVDVGRFWCKGSLWNEEEEDDGSAERAKQLTLYILLIKEGNWFSTLQ